MFYVIELKLAFSSNAFPLSIYNHALGQAGNAIPINPDQPNEEVTFIRLLKCYHDQNPTHPCHVTQEHIPYPPNVPPEP